MYTQFFGLNEKPFSITPDPRYLFMSERHGEGLAHLLYGVTDSGGFIQLTGEVGTGKTMLVRTLLGQLPDEVDVALILNPQVTVAEFLRAICRELNVELPDDTDSPMALVDALNRFLLDAHARGRRIILLVDEAQNLSKDVLEQLRLLTNLETAKQKLLQIILIGQPELRDVLARNDLRQLAQRVTGRYHLEPLTADEAAKYIDHRMTVAGGLGEVFSVAAKREIFRLSGGIPRLMNVICDRALLGAYSRETRVVDKPLVSAAADEISGRSRATRSYRAWLAAAATIAALGLAFIFVPIVTDTRNPTATATTDDETVIAEAVASTVKPTTPNTVVTDDTPSESLRQQLQNGVLTGSEDQAMQTLLALWDVQFDPNEGGNACSVARANGLSCLWQRGSFGLLRQLDRPALLTLTDSTGNDHSGVLIALADGFAELSIGGQNRRFPMQEISDVWLGQYLIVWRPPGGAPTSLRPGMRDENVAWLRESLAKLRGDELATDDSTFFDNQLEATVREFQRTNRLQVDGLAGEQTQIIINTQLAEDATPRLSGDT